MAEQKSRRAGYRRIAEQLELQIEDGVYPVGGLLPSYDAIATKYGVSKNVARDAVGAMEKKGVVDVAAGIGTTVLYKPSEVPPSERDQIMQQLADMRRQVEEVVAEVAELRREVRANRQPQPEARRAGQRASPTRP